MFSNSIKCTMLLLLIALCACEDHRLTLPPQPASRLKRTVSTTPSQTVTSVYNYDAKGKLTSIASNTLFLTGLSYQEVTSFTYDANDHMVLEETKRSDQWMPTLRTVYTYDAAGDVSEVAFYYGTPLDDAGSRRYDLQGRQVLSYDAQHLPRTLINYSPDQKAQYQNAFTYEGGNLIHTDSEEPSGYKFSTTYQYDDKLNPYYGLLFRTNSSQFNHNNRIDPLNTLDYDSQGRLARLVEFVNTPKLRSQTIFEYETL